MYIITIINGAECKEMNKRYPDSDPQGTPESRRLGVEGIYSVYSDGLGSFYRV